MSFAPDEDVGARFGTTLLEADLMDRVEAIAFGDSAVIRCPSGRPPQTGFLDPTFRMFLRLRWQAERDGLEL